MTQRGQAPGNVYGHAIAHAQSQLQFGKSTAEIERQLSRKYPSLEQIDVRSAVLAAVNARALGSLLTTGVPPQGGAPGGIPINPGIPEAYQYVVNVTYRIGGSTEPRTRTVIVNSSSALLGPDIEQEAENAARVADGAGQLNTDNTLIDWNVPPSYTVAAAYRKE